MPYSVRYSHTYSFGFSCILDKVQKYTDFAYFLAGGWGGGGSDPRIPYSGVRREYMVFSVFWPYSVRILPNHRIRRIRTEYGPCILVDRIPRILLRILCILFWWTEYRILSKKQNTDRIRTKYGQNTVITKRAIVITNRTPPSNGYRGTGPGERVSSVNDRSSHHRVVSGQLHNAQTPVNRPLTHVQTTKYVLRFDAPQTAQEGTGSNRYRGTGPSERVGSVNDQSSHHRMVPGQLHDAQTPAKRSLTQVQTTKYVLIFDAPDSIYQILTLRQ